MDHVQAREASAHDQCVHMTVFGVRVGLCHEIFFSYVTFSYSAAIAGTDAVRRAIRPGNAPVGSPSRMMISPPTTVAT